MRIFAATALILTALLAQAEEPSASWVCEQANGQKITQDRPCNQAERQASSADEAALREWLDNKELTDMAHRHSLCQTARASSAAPERRNAVDDCAGQ